MLCAIAGDIIGPVYEFSNFKATDLQPLIHARARYTDDTVCTVAIADCILSAKAQLMPYETGVRDIGQAAVEARSLLNGW